MIVRGVSNLQHVKQVHYYQVLDYSRIFKQTLNKNVTWITGKRRGMVVVRLEERLASDMSSALQTGLGN